MTGFPGRGAGQELFGSGSGQISLRAALDQQAQHGVKTADGAGPLGSEVMITISQQTQHDAVLVKAGDDVQARVVPSDNRCRAGIVGVGLVDPTVLEQAHPRRQLRWHINDMLAGGDELLGEQRAHPGRPLDRPRPRREPYRPRQQSFALITVGDDATCRSPFRCGRPRWPCGTPYEGRCRS